MRSTANLIVLWDFDGDYALAHLWLALPANGGQRPQDVSAFWCSSLDHPAEMTGPVPVAPTNPPDSGDDGMSQLIRPKIEIDEKKKSKG